MSQQQIVDPNLTPIELGLTTGGVEHWIEVPPKTRIPEKEEEVPDTPCPKKPRQARYWILTIPAEEFSIPLALPAPLSFLKGQQEIGAGGFNHWQLVCAFKNKTSLKGVKELFGRKCHAEPSRSEFANAYVWKEETRVEGTFFESDDDFKVVNII